mgnify:CR=1 FL=1|tara:strand:+ start:7410 stop:7622 length:213 start_codon:yes stop_codon:yes gene_type:complete
MKVGDLVQNKLELRSEDFTSPHYGSIIPIGTMGIVTEIVHEDLRYVDVLFFHQGGIWCDNYAEGCFEVFE